MDPINPWLDPAEVRRLAEKLLAPSREEIASSSRETGFSDQFIGFAPLRANPAPVPPAVPDPPAPAPTAMAPVQVSPPAPIEPVVEPPTVMQVIARGPFLDRIHRFRDWLHRHFAASGVFILDREGAVIFDESGHGKLHFLARSLALTSRRPGNSPRNVHVKVGTSATLEVIPVETPYGWLVLGAVVPDAMPPAAVAAVMEAMTQVAAPPTTPA